MRKACLYVVIAQLGLICANTISLAQTARILYTSADIQMPAANTGINRIINRPINNSLVVRLTDGSTQRVPIKNVWGYIREDGTVLRQYKGDFFEIVSQKDSVMYKNSLVLQIGRSPRVLTNYYFSKDLNSSIFRK